ncbi:MAG: glycosyltransferase [Lachnospiraceae bacterium]|nr:glycosyltransferase [Lachnospiraceae bacterium]
MKTIALVVNKNTSGGAERVMVNLAAYFASKEYRVMFINGDADSAFYPVDRRVEVIKLNDDHYPEYRRSAHIVRDLIKLFRREKPDAVIVFLFNMELPVILAGLLTHTRVYASVRNSMRSFSRRICSFRRHFYPRIAGVVFQSSRIAAHDDFKHLKNKAVIMNPLSAEMPDSPDVIGKSDRKKWIITAGRLVEQKNHKLLIDAFSDLLLEYPEYELHIFGKGPLLPDLEQQINSLHLEGKVVLESEVSDAIWNNRTSCCFVMSSDYEGFPNALTEAMASGIPVISSDFDSGVAVELIQDGENGFVFPVGEKQALLDAMRKMLSLTDAQYLDMVRKDLLIREMLDNETIGRQWEQFIFQDS